MRRATTLALAVAVLATLVSGQEARARPEALPFEMAVVLHGCEEIPFGADRLAAAVEAAFEREPLTPLVRGSAPIRVWFRAPRCGATDRRVQVAVEIANTSAPRTVLAIAPTGATPQERSLHLAREAHAVLTRLWPGVMAAASGNPYVVDMPVAFDANPYRQGIAQRGASGAPVDSMPPNPYRR